MNGLQKREIWQVIPKMSLPHKANILSSRFVLTLKNFGSADEHAKARYVAQGNRDREKAHMVHNINILRQSSTRIIVAVSAIKGFRLFSLDVRQAYLQSEDKMTRNVFLLPKRADLKYFGLCEEDILEPLKPIYGMKNAGDYRGVTVNRHVKHDLGLVPLLGDPLLYVKRKEEDLDGLLGMYVDDSLLGGNDDMQELTKLSLRRFDSNERAWDNYEFFGTSVETHEEGSFSVTQEAYKKKLKPIPMDASFARFRSYRSVLAWIGCTRPDSLCALTKPHKRRRN